MNFDKIKVVTFMKNLHFTLIITLILLKLYGVTLLIPNWPINEVGMMNLILKLFSGFLVFKIWEQILKRRRAKEEKEEFNRQYYSKKR